MGFTEKQQKIVDATMAEMDFVEYLIEMDGDTHQWRNLSLKKLPIRFPIQPSISRS